MKREILSICVLGLLGLTCVMLPTNTQQSQAGYYQARQYYGGWNYNEINRYHYRQYYYKPYATATTYSYHYVVYYPSQPRYYYYYNPVKQYYWGRYDTKEKGYSLLAEADRKDKLEDIKESAFPKPGEMPAIPDSKDSVLIDTPPSDTPKEEKK